MKILRPYDPVFLGLALVLTVAGLFILASASLGISAERFGYPYYYLLHQIAFGIIPGGIAMFWFSRVDYHFWKRNALWILLASILLMFLVFIPNIGLEHGGAKRWIALGPINFQPSELLKFSFVAYLAAWFETRSKDIGSFKFGLLPFLIMSGFIASFLILQPDIGTLLVLLAAAAGLFGISGGTMRQIVAMILVAVVILGILLVIKPYLLDRVTVFFNPSHDPQGVGYQIRQAFIAIGSGGFWGRGFALSRQKFSYLPEPMGDSVFAIVAEELGFVGGVVILLLFLLFYLRGIAITRYVPDLFGKLLGTGFLFLIIFQAFINISAITGLGPLTGIPLSFISYGGSALAITLSEVGVILNISKTRT